MRKLFIFLIIFLSIGNFMSRGQMTGRYYFFDSYWIDEPGSWYYANRNVGYNVFSYSASPYVKWEGGLYLPLFSGSNFFEGLYWLGMRVNYLSSKIWQAGIRIRVHNFFNASTSCPLCEAYLPNIYAGGGFTYDSGRHHFTFEAAFFKIIKYGKPKAIFSAGYSIKTGKKWFLWTEAQYIPCRKCKGLKNYIDYNVGGSFKLTQKLILDLGISYENNLYQTLISFVHYDKIYIYPLVGLQWQLGETTTKPDETEPFYD